MLSKNVHTPMTRELQSSVKVIKHVPSSHQVVTKYSLSIRQVILLLEALAELLPAKLMRELVGKKDATYFRLTTIQPMIVDEIIAPVDADSIRSPKQKYYLTGKGSALLSRLQNEVCK